MFPFSYLRSTVSEFEKLKKELANRICKAGNVCGELYKTIFGNNEARHKTKLLVYNAVLLYGGES